MKIKSSNQKRSLFFASLTSSEKLNGIEMVEPRDQAAKALENLKENIDLLQDLIKCRDRFTARLNNLTDVPNSEKLLQFNKFFAIWVPAYKKTLLTIDIYLNAYNNAAASNTCRI